MSLAMTRSDWPTGPVRNDSPYPPRESAQSTPTVPSSLRLPDDVKACHLREQREKSPSKEWVVGGDEYPQAFARKYIRHPHPPSRPCMRGKKARTWIRRPISGNSSGASLLEVIPILDRSGRFCWPPQEWHQRAQVPFLWRPHLADRAFALHRLTSANAPRQVLAESPSSQVRPAHSLPHCAP